MADRPPTSNPPLPPPLPPDGADPSFPASLWARARELPWVGPVLEHEASRLLVAGVLVGVLGGVAAGLFDRAMLWVGLAVLGTGEPALLHPSAWRSLFGPTVMGVLGGLVIAYGTKNNRPQSVPDVLVRAQVDRPALSLQDGLASAAAAALVVGGGHSGGREGPIVQFASTLANEVCTAMRVPPRHFRALVASGAAAGIAASFNTPVGGAFFALEIILGDFGVESFAPVVAATVTGTVVGQALLGDRIALHLPPFDLESPVELVFYLVLGAIAGVAAVALKRAVLWGAARGDALNLPIALRCGLAGLAVGTLAAAGFPEVMGNGYAWMEQAITEPRRIGVLFLALLLVVKIAATAATAGGRGGAGLFAPGLHVGAILGLLVGKAAMWLAPQQVHSPGAYGMVGMAAVASGLMHAPITMTLMLFEMTGNYAVILPLLVAVAAAGLVSRLLGSESVYQAELRRRGITLERRPTQVLTDELTVRQVMRPDPPTFAPDEALRTVAQKMVAARLDEAFVVEGGRLVGTIQLSAVTERLFAGTAATAADLATRELPGVAPDQPLGDAVPLFFGQRTSALPVVAAGNVLVGVLFERDVVAAYHRAVEQHDGGVARFPTAGSGGPIELPVGHVVDVVEVGDALAGRTLAGLGLRRYHGCTVVAYSVWDGRTGAWTHQPVEPARKLAKGDRMVVVGPADAVRKLG